jgi:hypothetical protein
MIVIIVREQQLLKDQVIFFLQVECSDCNYEVLHWYNDINVGPLLFLFL